MTGEAASTGFRGDGRRPTDPALLVRPLDFIAADHLRERQICADLDRLAASDRLERDLAQAALRFLNEELAIHMRDEAEDLFPLMRRRCPPEEEIDHVIKRIETDQHKARAMLPQVRPVLACCLDDARVPNAAEVDLLRRFAHHTRRHLIAENAILLPLARAHLTRKDLESLRLRMLARRSLNNKTGTSDA